MLMARDNRKMEQNGCLQPNVSAKLALKVNLLNEANAKIQIAKEKFLHSEENAQLKTAKANLLKQENLRNLAIIKLEEAEIEIKEAEKKIEKAILEIRLAEARVQESETKKAIETAKREFDEAEFEVEVIKRVNQIEEIFWRFPKVGEKIFKKLDVRDLEVCRSVSKWWQKFIDSLEINPIQKICLYFLSLIRH